MESRAKIFQSVHARWNFPLLSISHHDIDTRTRTCDFPIFSWLLLDLVSASASADARTFVCILRISLYFSSLHAFSLLFFFFLPNLTDEMRVFFLHISKSVSRRWSRRGVKQEKRKHRNELDFLVVFHEMCVCACVSFHVPQHVLFSKLKWYAYRRNCCKHQQKLKPFPPSTPPL